MSSAELATSLKREVPAMAVPRQGYVLATAAERVGGPIRAAVNLIRAAIPPGTQTVWESNYASRLASGRAARPLRTFEELASWSLVTAWIVGVASRSITASSSISDAETWFLDSTNGMSSHLPAPVLEQAEGLLRQVADADSFDELLPYILDPHGEGSRLSVRRRPETSAARAIKKKHGVFYTPADVAAHMASKALEFLNDDAYPVTFLDPACGTGVFLKAILAEVCAVRPNVDPLDVACSCLYGSDIDDWAVDATAFVLLSSCLKRGRARSIAPIAAWHAVRLNLVPIDSLRLDAGWGISQDDPYRVRRLDYRARLKSGDVPPATGETLPEEGPVPFGRLFPEIAEGPRLVIGNPPYADLHSRSDLMALTQRYETARMAARVACDTYPLFLEQMVRLAAPGVRGGAMVVPLSVSCNTGAQFAALRGYFRASPGKWRFAFFDREPHALFGEDVKTRNAIVFWNATATDSESRVLAGPLKKWRGSGRKRMFESISFVPVGVDIRAGIPKPASEQQAKALAHLRRHSASLRTVVPGFDRAVLQDAFDGGATTVYVGATAYNFLNVFLSPAVCALKGPLTEHPLHALHCASRADALRIYGLLNSRLAFWWWHIWGDGFHVSKGILQDLPVGNLFSGLSGERLALSAAKLWAQASKAPIVSVNRGRTSIAFSAAPFGRERADIDEIAVEAVGLDLSFCTDLERFTDNVVNACV